MKTKQLIATAMGLSLVAGFAFTLPAFADTNANVSAGVNVNLGGRDNGDNNVNNNEQEQGQDQNEVERGPGGPMMGAWRGMGMMGRPAVVGTVSTINGTTLTVSGRNGF